jgi:NitT/TauT family transport system substrate-binding protein
MKALSRLAVAGVVVCLLLAAAAAADAAETKTFRIARQPGLVYLQAVLMEERKLIEKHAAALGMPDVKLEWSVITSGGVVTEAILSNTVDLAVTGVSNMLLAWSRTNGAIKSVAGVSGMPQLLLTRNPAVKTIKDFGPDDRIAVPTIRASMQAMILGMALEQAYGPGNHGRLDSNQVQLGHPDATQALLSPTHEVNSHLSIAPFYEIALKAPAVHVVLDSTDVLGGPGTITNAWGTAKFVEANPVKMTAFLAALDEASALIARDPEGVSEIYLAATQERISVAELAALIRQPTSIFSATPRRTMIFADYMNRIGMIKTKATSWKDYTFPAIHERDGS